MVKVKVQKLSNRAEFLYPQKEGSVKDLASTIIAFEVGELDHDQTIGLFQYLVDTGMAWTLQGSYGRTAVNLLQAGLITQIGGKDGI